jgi:hypothetical protein
MACCVLLWTYCCNAWKHSTSTADNKWVKSLLFRCTVSILYVDNTVAGVHCGTSKKKLRGFSPETTYTKWPSNRHLSAKLVRTWADRGCRVVSTTNPTDVNFGFLHCSHYFLEIASQLSSWGWVDPVPDPPLLRKSGNWTPTSGSVARNSDHYTVEDSIKMSGLPFPNCSADNESCSILECRLLSIKTWLIWLWVFPPGDVHVNL